MTTLLAGNSASFTLGTLQSLNISTGGTGSLSFTSSSEMAQPSFTASVANGNFGPYNVSMAVVMTMTAGSADYTVVGGADVTAVVGPLTGGIEFASPDGLDAEVARTPSSGYFCHLWAGSSSNGDGVVPDISGNQSNATFHTNMTKALAWATAGFASTDTGGAYRTFLLPALNYDYAAGESLIIVWKGRGTAPATSKGIVADSEGSSDSGFAVRVDAEGKIQSYLSDGSGHFTDVSTNVLVEPTITHTYAIAIDGVAKKYEVHEDGVVVRSLIALGDGTTAYDTKTVKPVKLGTQDSFSTAANTVALSTQALVILRGRVGRGLPTDYRALMQSIQRTPDRLVTRRQW